MAPGSAIPGGTSADAESELVPLFETSSSDVGVDVPERRLFVGTFRPPPRDSVLSRRAPSRVKATLRALSLLASWRSARSARRMVANSIDAWCAVWPISRYPRGLLAATAARGKSCSRLVSVQLSLSVGIAAKAYLDAVVSRDVLLLLPESLRASVPPPLIDVAMGAAVDERTHPQMQSSSRPAAEEPRRLLVAVPRSLLFCRPSREEHRACPLLRLHEFPSVVVPRDIMHEGITSSFKCVYSKCSLVC